MITPSPIKKGNFMIRVDYNSYLNSQTEWARSLIREARRLKGGSA